MAKVHRFNAQKGGALFYFLIVLLIVAFFSPLVTYLLHHFFHILGPLDFMPLSLSGVENGFLWQPLTYFFLISNSLEISLNSLVVLAFHLFLLWITGKEIISSFGHHHFFILYMGSGLFAAGIVLLFQWLFNISVPISTLYPPLFAVLTVWLLLYSDLVFSFLFFVRVKAKWLVVGLFVISLLINLISGKYSIFFAHAAGILFGYLYGWLILKMSPKELFHLNSKRRKRKNPSGKNSFYSEKIISIDDEDFRK